MRRNSRDSFAPVLANRDFRALWLAQLLAQTSQHAIHFIQMVLVERLTGSTVHLAFTILAFTLPGIIFSPIAGVVVDRLPKKFILVGSNLARVVLACGYILALATLKGTPLLIAIYLLTFLMATLAQFFAPAEAATIPLLVGERHLLQANSLFTLTMAISQMVGLVILGPLATRLLNVEGGFVLVGAMYLGAAALVATLPGEKVGGPLRLGESGSAIGSWKQLVADFKEGVAFVSGRRRLQSAMVQLVTVATLVMVMAMLAPGYSARVLGMEAENAVLVFAPAGLGMLLASGVVGRWGHLLRRAGFGSIGLVLSGFGFAGLGWLSLDYQRLLQPILRVYPGAALSLTTATMGIGLFLGLCMASVNILGQTRLQQESPPEVRGRVFSMQYLLNNLVGLAPMLLLALAADELGIPHVLEIIGLGAAVLGVASYLLERSDPGRKPAILSARSASREA